MQYKPIQFIRELCRHKTEAEIREAEENFRRYLMLVQEICEDLEQEEQLKNIDRTGIGKDNTSIRITSS